MYKAQLVLSAAKNNDKSIQIVSNAAYQAHKDSEPFLWQAGGLCEILGDVKLANKIYDEKYTKPKLKRYVSFYKVNIGLLSFIFI